MTKQFLKDAVGWGVILWLVGYVLGFVFYAFVPPADIGWYILPIGLVVMLWVLSRKVRGTSAWYYAGVGAVWTVVAVVLDWLLLVKLLHPADGYYKTDVYGYYALTYLVPVAYGLFAPRGTLAANAARTANAETAHQKVLALLDAKAELTNDDVQNSLGVSDSTATAYLNELVAQGKLRRVGDLGRPVRYVKNG